MFGGLTTFTVIQCLLYLCIRSRRLLLNRLVHLGFNKMDDVHAVDRSEADSGTSKASNKDCRSYSDSSEPIDKCDLSPLKLSATTQQKPPAQAISSSSPHRKEIQLSETIETLARPSLDADDIGSASQKSPDSVISTYDIVVSHSTDSGFNQLPGVQPFSGSEDVFQSRPAWDATVETQMQTTFDEPAPDCTPGMARTT